jgi:hypothetical protein
MRGDHCPDGGGKAIAREKSFNKSQHSIHCVIEAYYRSFRITSGGSPDGIAPCIIRVSVPREGAWALIIEKDMCQTEESRA